MSKQINRLSARKVATLSAPGMHADGAGLYLRISRGQHSGKRWVFIYRRPRDSKRCELGLGSATTVKLAEARNRAADARACLADGTDPRDLKHKAKACPTFGEVADQHIATMEPRWRNEKHKAQWRMTLQVYAGPLRDLAVDRITTGDILCVLRPIWQPKPETASRVRGRIEAVLDAATAQGLRTGANPAAWKTNLQFILPPAKKLTRGHHRAMVIDDVPEFMSQLGSRPAIAARCLEFSILTASRTGEALGTRWEELDLDHAVWTLPVNRMRKSDREHCVPLSRRAIEILKEMATLKTDTANGGYVFPGQRRDQPLSNMALLSLLKRMKIAVTVHGFRSTFRDWAGDRTEFPRELVELALSHQVGNDVERAYRRNGALERRRPLMEAWTDFCASTGVEIDEKNSNILNRRKATGRASPPNKEVISRFTDNCVTSLTEIATKAGLSSRKVDEFKEWLSDIPCFASAALGHEGFLTKSQQKKSFDQALKRISKFIDELENGCSLPYLRSYHHISTQNELQQNGQPLTNEQVNAIGPSFDVGLTGLNWWQAILESAIVAVDKSPPNSDELAKANPAFRAHENILLELILQNWTDRFGCLVATSRTSSLVLFCVEVFEGLDWWSGRDEPHDAMRKRLGRMIKMKKAERES